jgi:hypothetical protein
MKIISKYKDFYDYNYQYGAPDESIVYKRQCSCELDVSILKNEEELKKLDLLRRTESFLRPNTLCYTRYCICPKYTDTSYIIGIYPYLFICPCMGHIEMCIWDNHRFKERLDKIIPIDFNYVVDGKTLWQFIREHIDSNIKLKKMFRTEHDYTQYKLRPQEWVRESPETFKIFGTPIFMYGEACNVLIKHQEFAKIRDVEPTFIKDFSLSSLSVNLLKYHEDFIKNVDVYSSIENFLYSMKQEPISEPDNKTKILNAGFDLKTSFRKM